jgi:hypothetical protein
MGNIINNMDGNSNLDDRLVPSNSIKKRTKPKKPTAITRKLKKEIELSLKKIRGIVNHIQNVQDNALLLGEKLIEVGEIDLGKELIALAFRHDNSKFFGIEWKNMAPGVEVIDTNSKFKLKLAIEQHQSTNSHHPESWPGGIKGMPLPYLLEFVCDIKARSEEFGTNFREWIEERATKKWNFSKDDDVYKNIMKYVDLLCEKPFVELSKL